MKTSQKMFLRRHGKRSHEEVLVYIDWADVSEDDMKLFASYYVLHRVQHDMKDYEHVLPEVVTYRAADFIHNEPLVDCSLDGRDLSKWKAPPKSKARKEIDKLFEGLTREEILILLDQ